MYQHLYSSIKCYLTLPILLNGKMTNGCDVQPIQSYNINIYNPNINCVNICSPPVSGPFSSFQQDNNQIFKEKIPLRT